VGLIVNEFKQIGFIGLIGCLIMGISIDYVNILHLCLVNSFPLENWRPMGCPCTTWMKTTQQDLESLNLSLNEAIDVAQNHPL